MRRILMAAAVAALICGAASAQSTMITLQNQEDSAFYYVIDPRELAGLTVGSSLLATKVANYFSVSDPGTAFKALGPQEEARIAGLSKGTHLLVGFFAQQDADVFPVRVMSLQADPSIGERFYAVFSSSAQLRVPRGVGKLAQFTRVIAGQGTEAALNQPPEASSTLAPIATFSSTYDPSLFSRESVEGFRILPIAESRAWIKTGTRIASVRGTLDSSGLKLLLNIPNGLSSSVSYFLYVFGVRELGTENSLTLEIQPLARDEGGACILWHKGFAPRLLGAVKNSATSVELEVATDELASAGLADSGQNTTVDLTACWYDRSTATWEEFYYTTFPLSAIDTTR
jgi:hypothetical protein